MLLLSPVKTKKVQAAAAFSPAYSEFKSDFSTATITKIQLPGIIPNNNNHSPPSNPPSLSFDFANTSNASSNNNNNNTPPPPPLTHNTRARPSLIGPTLNNPNLKVEQIIDRAFDHPTGKIANNPEDLKEGGAVLGQGFGVITDMQVGPGDGYLYILRLQGSLYRIVPSSSQ